MPVPRAGPQNLRSCPERGGARAGAQSLPERPGVQRRRKCETSPPSYPGARPGLLRSLPRAPASEGRSSHPSGPLAPEPGRRSREWGGGGSESRPGRARGSAEYNDLPLFQRLQGPSVTSLPPSGHFTGPGLTPSRAGCPQPPPVLSLETLAALPGSSTVPAPGLSRASPEPVWYGLHLAFLALCFLPSRVRERPQPKSRI